MNKINIFKRFLLIQSVIFLLISCQKKETLKPERLIPQTVVEDLSLPSIPINGTLLHSEAFGNPSDPMIVALHDGPGGDYRSMLNMKSYANDGYYVVFYDQRGTGLSQRHDANENVFRFQDLIDDLDAVINYYQTSDTQKVFLAGHSFGSVIALAYTNQNPGKIVGLILSEPKGINQNTNLETSNFKSLIKDLNDEINQDYYDDMSQLTDEHEKYDYALMIIMLANYDADSLEPVPFWRYGSVCRSEITKYIDRNNIDLTSNMDQYTNKVLICYSEFSAYYSREEAELTAAAFQDAEIVMIYNCGQNIPFEGWDDYYPKTIEYLNQIAK